MLHPSTKRLIDKLSEMTRKQRVAWSEGEDGTITHDTEGYRVVLTPEPHAVLLTDALGKEIESCSPEEFVDETDSAGRPYASFVADLYREAHRHARGAEKAINTVLKGLETIDAEPEEAPAPALDPADLVEDPGDDTEAYPEAYPEVEGQNDMARAVASMADEVNGGVRETAPEPEIEADEEPETSVPEYETIIAAEPDVLPDTTPEAEALAEAEPDALDDPESEMEAAADAPEDVAADAPEPFDYTPAFTASSEAEPETHESEPSLWPEDENAPVLETAPDFEESDPEPEPDPAPAAAPAVSMSSPFGGGYFGAGTGTLAQYTMSPAAPAEPEPAPQAEVISSDVDYAGEITPEAPQIDLPEDAPVTAEAPVAPEPQQRFSLSGMSSGFGLGAAGRTGAMPNDVPPASGAPDIESPRMVIDGTVDLPDEIDLSEFSADTETPAYPDPVAEPESAPLEFSDQAETPADAPERSRPEERAFEVPPETVEPMTQEPEAEEAPPPPAAPKRFNPWN